VSQRAVLAARQGSQDCITHTIKILRNCFSKKSQHNPSSTLVSSALNLWGVVRGDQRRRHRRIGFAKMDRFRACRCASGEDWRNRIQAHRGQRVICWKSIAVSWAMRKPAVNCSASTSASSYVSIRKVPHAVQHPSKSQEPTSRRTDACLL